MLARASSGLAAALALAACAHGGGRQAEVRALVEANLEGRGLCVPLPQGDFASLRPGSVTLAGYRATDGFLRFPDREGGGGETIRATYDLLVTLGLFSVTEEPRPAPSRLVRRRYTPTTSGQAHYRTLSPSHGAPDWQALCVGRRRLVALRSPGGVRRVTPCEETRQATYTYRYKGLPGWMDDPRLQARFPDLGTRGAAARPREGATELVRYGGAWQVQRGDPLVRVVCVRD